MCCLLGVELFSLVWIIHVELGMFRVDKAVIIWAFIRFTGIYKSLLGFYKGFTGLWGKTWKFLGLRGKIYWVLLGNVEKKEKEMLY